MIKLRGSRKLLTTIINLVFVKSVIEAKTVD